MKDFKWQSWAVKSRKSSFYRLLGTVNVLGTVYTYCCVFTLSSRDGTKEQTRGKVHLAGLADLSWESPQPENCCPQCIQYSKHTQAREPLMAFVCCLFCLSCLSLRDLFLSQGRPSHFSQMLMAACAPS